MKLYWRPHSVSLVELVFLALCAAGLLVGVETLLVGHPQPDHLLRHDAARLSQRAISTITAWRTAHGPPLDPIVDPTGSGLIGLHSTPVTTTPGKLSAKQTTVNPNFAAIIVRDLRAAGVKPGDVVAVGVSGSFPALNISVYAACTVMHLDCLVVASATGSQWGANMPDLLWIDMERILAEAGVFKIRSLAASYGGLRDRALGLSAAGHRLLDAALARNGLRFLTSKTIKAAVEGRVAIYLEAAKGRPIKAYINVGGGTASVGSTLGKKMYKAGLNLKPPELPLPVPAVMDHFGRAGVPVLHLTNVTGIATRAGLPEAPRTLARPGVGELFLRLRYNRWLALGAALALFGLLVLVVRTNWGHRVFGRWSKSQPPERMI